jgi:hypothetical protein
MPESLDAAVSGKSRVKAFFERQGLCFRGQGRDGPEQKNGGHRRSKEVIRSSPRFHYFTSQK